MRKIGYGLLLALVAVLAFFGGSVFKPKPSIESTTLSSGFKSIAELNLAEYYFKDIAELDEPLKPLGIELPLTNKKLLLTYKASAKAGIRDFEAIEVSTDEGAKKITVKVPKVEVTETKLDYSSAEVYNETSGIFNKVKTEDSKKLIAREESKIKNKAIEAGILERARIRAEEILKSHVEDVISGTQQEGYAVEVQWVD